MTPKIQKLENVYTNLWSLYNLLFILEKSYISLLLDKYI